MVHETEQETVEALKRWWQQNGSALIAGLAIGLAGVFGWQYWQTHQRSQSEAAAVLYQDLQERLGDAAAGPVDGVFDRLRDDYSDSAYAALAGLAVAGEAVEAGALERAEEALRWVVEHANLPELAQVARLRLARVLRARDLGEEALAQLDALQGGFRAEALEIRGDIMRERGELAAARQAYEESLAAYNAEGRPNRWVRLKLQDLASPQGIDSGEEEP